MYSFAYNAYEQDRDKTEEAHFILAEKLAEVLTCGYL